MANFNNYPERCDSCGKQRTCNDAGLCHECEEAEREAVAVVANGEWTPGGYAL